MSRLIKYALTLLLWRNYKVLIVTTLILIFTVVIINMAHSDYLTWAQMQEPIVATGASFIYKYCAFGALLIGFLLINHYANKRLEAKEAAQKGKGNVVLDKLLRAKDKAKTQVQQSFNQVKSTQRRHDSAKEATQASGGNDPFANIRKKAKLRTQAEVIMDNKENSKNVS